MTNGGSTPHCPTRPRGSPRDRTASACGSPGMERRSATPRRWGHPTAVPCGCVWRGHPIDTHDPFVLHKTTRRGHYEAARAAFPDADDVILYNEAGEVTESCIANVVILRNGRLVTPPLGCGLLNGTFRAELLERGEIHEEAVNIPELKKADKIFLINSVRKWREAVLAPEDLP